LFRLLDPSKFGAAFQRFMAAFSQQCQGVVAIDGKVLRRSHDKAIGRSALHMVSAPAFAGTGMRVRAADGAGPDRHRREVE
jgi:hypothetical protein